VEVSRRVDYVGWRSKARGLVVDSHREARGGAPPHPTLVFLTLELKNTFISFVRSYTNHVCSEACEACEAVRTLFHPHCPPAKPEGKAPRMEKGKAAEALYYKLRPITTTGGDGVNTGKASLRMDEFITSFA